MSRSKFYDKIKDAVIERQVEDVYNEGINLYFPSKDGITYPFNCDGFVDTKTENGKVLKLIIEYKLDEALANNVSRAKVLIQVIYYLKKFEQNGWMLPNVCMVGDKNECFVLHCNSLLKYLDEEANWNISPSNAASANPEFVLKIANDEEINPFVFNIDKDFSFSVVADKIKDLAENVQRYVRVTEHNIATIYDYFCRNVLRSKNISSHDLVGVFMGIIMDGDNYYQHPNKKNILVTPNGNLNIDGNGFRAFFNYFQRNYTPQERNNLTAIADRLIEDTDRRNKGDFWTPTPWVDYAHKMISESLGEDWKDKYVVWDNCWGTGNLTRDYWFNELYCSTLFQSELDIGSRYNPEATKFQFDFLNDSLDKIPSGLMKALKEDKPIVFLLNPPYAKATPINGNDGSDLAKTKINDEMIADKMGIASSILYCQFLYNIINIKNKFNLTNCHIALFCKPTYLSNGGTEIFRTKLLNNFSYNKGILFNASEFSDCSNGWGIHFAIYDGGKNINNNEFNHSLITNSYGKLKEVGQKILYNCDNKVCANNIFDCTKKHTRGIKTFSMKSALCIKDKECYDYKDAIGYINNDSNNQMQQMRVFLASHVIAANGNKPIFDENFNNVMALFSARKLIDDNWINDKDEYLAPNESHPKFDEFVNDSIVYSLFNTSSNQSSLRQVEYKDKLWDIKNEFFWMSKKDMMKLANDNNNDDCYEDARTDSDRYVYKKLKEIELSEEAKAVLDKATELVKSTFKYRPLFDSEHPEYQINNWDCGWYQIKAVAKEYCKKELDEFKELYKALADKMRPMVYELGFLK